MTACLVTPHATNLPPPSSPSPFQAERAAHSMPVARLQNDLLRDGATAQKQAALAPHPVQTIQANVRGARHAADG